MQLTTSTRSRRPALGDVDGAADDWTVLPPRGTALGGVA